MKKLILTLIASLLLIACNNNKKTVNDPVTYDVEFDVDYNNCGTDPLV